jgi:hypothetical protein
MHSAGIEAMGILMDKIYARHGGKMDERAIRSDLQKLAAHCCWTSGTWEESGLDWNEIQSTPKHIRVLADTLVKLYASRAAR